jgi:Domain of unknown function (DUF4149)
MTNALRFVRVFALGAWVGAIIYFAAVVTQGAFTVLPNRDMAGLLVGYTLGGLHLMGLIAAVIFVGASVAIAKSLRAVVEPAVIGVILMSVLTVASQRYVIPKMATLRSQMVSVEATPGNDPRRIEFDRLHGMSVDLEVGVLLIGLASLFLAAREKRAVGGERQTALP